MPKVCKTSCLPFLVRKRQRRSQLSHLIGYIKRHRSKALGVSYTSVHRIMNGKKPCKSNRPKERAKILDDFDHCVIKRTIHGLYSQKIALTVSIIHKEIKDSIKISKSKLTLTLIDLGYTYKKIGDNQRVLYDQVSIINDGRNYLRKIKSFREAVYDIVYMDETKSLHRLYVASE